MPTAKASTSARPPHEPSASERAPELVSARRGDAYRTMLKWARTVHIYLTMLALVGLIFFAATGFMMNHEEWFGLGEPRTRMATATVPVELLRGPDKLAIVELLRAKHAATGAVTDLRVDEDTVRVQFKAPGRQTMAEIQRADGRTDLTYETRGLAGLLADLHRGQSTGERWKLLIDATALLLLLACLTGLVLWISLPKRRTLGLLALGASLALIAGAYLLALP